MYMKNIILIILVLILNSCALKKTSPQLFDYGELEVLKRGEGIPVTIDTRSAEDIMATTFMQENVEEIGYVQLDGRIPLGKISKLIGMKNKFILLSNDLIFVYDDKGNYLYHINRKGHGHNEYLRISDIQILPNSQEILAIDDLGKAYYYFDLASGNFLRKENSMISTLFACKYQGLYFSSLVSGNDFNDEETWGLVASDSAGFKYKQFLFSPIQNADLLMDNLHVYDNVLYYNPIFSDTVYMVDAKLRYSPVFVVKHEKSIWQKRNVELSFDEVLRCMNDEGYTFLNGNHVLPLGNVLFFQIMRAHGRGLLDENYVYNFSEDKVYHLNTNKIGGQVYSIFPHEIFDEHDGVLYGLYSDGQKLKEICQEGKLQILDKELIKLLSSEKINHNPIVVLLKFKQK